MEAAQTALGRALELLPNDSTALKLLADSQRDRGRYREAAISYGKLINQPPDHVGVLLSLAKCFFELGALEDTQAALEYVLTVDPANQVARDD